MIRTIISHDIATTAARVKFEHNGVILEDNFLLKMVLPGSKQIFEQLDMPFDEAVQLRALDKLTETIQANIESGAIVNAPEPIVPVESPTPPADPEPTPPEE